MVIIISDKIEPWFEYIWEQFVLINSLVTGYKLITYSDCRLDKYANSKYFFIEYGTNQRYSDSLFIPKKNEFKTDDYFWIREYLPVYCNTILENGYNMHYDIFYNAFVHLSRLEEWQSERNGNFVRSYSFHHPRKEKRIWKIPIVNYLFNEFEGMIKTKYPEVYFGDRAKPIIELSHDVDYINKTNQLRIKQTLFHFFNCCRFLKQFDLRNSLIKFKNGIEFVFRNSSYWCFDNWTDFEKGLNLKSVYYFFSKTDNQKGFNPKQWFLDPSYDIARNKRLKEKCKALIANGNRIGIHGSYFSAENESVFRREKDGLENAIGHKITKTRQHWLNYCESKTPYIQDMAGIEEDSTIGFNDISGFRAGVASRYNPYDHRNNTSLPLKEVPLVVMDSHLYDYSTDADSQDFEWLFSSINNVKNFMVSVDWHQRVISRDYGWEAGLRQFLNLI